MHVREGIGGSAAERAGIDTDREKLDSFAQGPTHYFLLTWFLSPQDQVKIPDAESYEVQRHTCGL